MEIQVTCTRTWHRQAVNLDGVLFVNLRIPIHNRTVQIYTFTSKSCTCTHMYNKLSGVVLSTQSDIIVIPVQDTHYLVNTKHICKLDNLHTVCVKCRIIICLFWVPPLTLSPCIWRISPEVTGVNWLPIVAGIVWLERLGCVLKHSCCIAQFLAV